MIIETKCLMIMNVFYYSRLADSLSCCNLNKALFAYVSYDLNKVPLMCQYCDVFTVFFEIKSFINLIDYV